MEATLFNTRSEHIPGRGYADRRITLDGAVLGTYTPTSNGWEALTGPLVGRTFSTYGAVYNAALTAYNQET